MLTKDSCARILEAGGNLRVSGLTTEACVELAAIAKRKGVMLEIASGLTVESWVKVAQAGGKHVLIDISE